MSNLDLWYCAGIAVLGASFSYIVVSAVRFMGPQEQKPPTPANEGDAPPTTFLRHALVAFVGIMIGSQLLQHHQDQQEISCKDARKDTALVGAAQATASAPGGVNVGGALSAGLGVRPTQRPPRGFFSVEEAEKARLAAANTPAPVLAASGNTVDAKAAPAP